MSSATVDSMPYRGFRPVYGGNAVYSGRGGAFAYSPSEASTGMYSSSDSFSQSGTGVDGTSSDAATEASRSESVTDTGPPQPPVHVQDPTDVESTEPVKPNQRLKDFFSGMGQGFRHLFSLPGLLTLAAATVVGALLPWTVPFMVLLGLGVALFQIIGGMVSDDWQQAGRGAFSLLSSLVLGSLLSEFFPIGGRNGLDFALPGRSPHPLQFRDTCGDAFINVNRWYPIDTKPQFILTGTNYSVPWYVSGFQNTGRPITLANAAEGTSLPGLASEVPTAIAKTEDVPTVTPSQVMLASAATHDSIPQGREAVASTGAQKPDMAESDGNNTLALGTTDGPMANSPTSSDSVASAGEENSSSESSA